MILLVIIGVYAFKQYMSVMPKTNVIKKQQQLSKDKKEDKRLTTVFDSQDAQDTEIDDYLQQSKFNGTVAVFHDGKIKFNKGYGIKNFQNNEHNSANTMYLIGSSQKFFTGIMLKKLVDEGKVNMNNPVSDYIPWFTTTKPIPLTDLMLHKSGLFKYKGSTHFRNLDDAVHAIQQRGIQEGFYKRHRYNDGNYLVLAKVIESVLNKPYSKVFNETIDHKYKLKHTAFYDDPNAQNDMAIGYKNVNNQPQYMDPIFLSQYYGAGNLYMAPYDMGKFIVDIQRNRVFPEHETRPFLKESKTKKYPDAYRYGFYSFKDKNRINGGFYGHVFTCYFNDKYIVVVGTNYENPEVKNEAIINHIYSNILKQGGNYNQVGQTY
ncbi:serine hydrolase domain-containing protein [Staphylococcus lloydii]|uniref:serine hydrolase domain-containing protein n=1 Tax=Staphylococcus lloydii TaxID=2781774 RepID=UPI00292803D2|nr:serine hydrolase domain-containing protein [Staphylococcus lloydii]MDU9417336.1 serine hydrolase domain-containing protein [Staphylococcus lloydii]